jgi:hypothetical protein
MIAKLGEKFATGVADTGGRWCTLTCEYLPNGILWGWGETDSLKKPEAKHLVTLSL